MVEKEGHVGRLSRHTDPIVACVRYESGLVAKTELAKFFGHIELLHSDKPTDRTCYLLVREEGRTGSYDEDRALVLLGADIGITSWHILHPALKIDASALLLVGDQDGFRGVARAHHQRRILASSSVPRKDGYFFNTVLSQDDTTPGDTDAATHNAQEYDVQVTLMPGMRASVSARDSVENILLHLQKKSSSADIEADKAFLVRLSKAAASGSTDKAEPTATATSEIWDAGLDCLNEALAASNDNPRRLHGTKNAANALGLEFRSLAKSSPLGFHLSSVDLHGGRRLDEKSSPALTRACHIMLFAKLAQHPDVLNVAVSPRVRLFNDVSKSLTQSDTYADGQGNLSVLWPYFSKGLDGSGQVIIVADTGLDTDHCQFREPQGVSKVRPSSWSNPIVDLSKRKVVQYTFWTHSDTDDVLQGHGTHMASSSCGSNINAASSIYDGVASGAKLSFWDIGKGDDLSTPVDSSILFAPGLAADAHIFSGSWGSTANQHDQSSYIMDQYAYEKDTNLLAVFAAGNDGQEGYFSVCNPGMSKNVLTVGAFESNFFGSSPIRAQSKHNVAYFSSMGPTYDWRIKPDILSPGFSVTAAKADDGPSCAFKAEAGSSSATALTSGLAALVRQYYMDARFYQTVTSRTAFTPSGALLKATLIHCGQSEKYYSPPLFTGSYAYRNPDTEIMQGTVLDGEWHASTFSASASSKIGPTDRPDYISGFGRIYLQNALPIPGVSNFPIDIYAYNNIVLRSNTEYSWFIQTPATGNWLKAQDAMLRCTLVWMDPPIIPFAEKNCAHDLDIIVTETVSLSSNYPEPSGNYPIWFGNGGSAPDSTNNVEQISISTKNINGRVALKKGAIYRVTVRANLLTQADTQAFSLVITTPKTSAGASVVTEPNTSGPATPVSTGLAAIVGICANDELEISATLSSHLAIGWQGGSVYTVKNKAGTPSYLHTGTMNYTQTLTQFRTDEVLCLKAGSYEVELKNVVNTGSNLPRDRFSSLGQTAVDINDCFIHLQGMYETLASITIAADADGILRCNFCDPIADSNGDKHFPIEVQMLGSIYGGRISYGWENGTSYVVAQSGTVLFQNTLNKGILGYHRYCLVEGEYQVGFGTISSDDDFGSRATADSGWTSGEWGVVEYSMRFMGCGFKPIGGVNAYREEYSDTFQTWFVYANPNPWVTIRATDEVDYCSTDFGDGWDPRWQPTDDETLVSITTESKSSTTIIIVAAAVAIIVIIAGIVYYFIRRGATSTSPMPTRLSGTDSFEVKELKRLPEPANVVAGHPYFENDFQPVRSL